MKTILSIAILSISLLSFGQDYKLFNASSRKVYTNYPIPDSIFSIAFDSARLVGTDSVYYNFTHPGNLIPSDICHFWGGPVCYQQNRPTWLGPEIYFNNVQSYKFFTLNGDTLSLNFSVQSGDSALIYKNTTEKFYLTFSKADTITVLNFVDSARFYTIIHTDALGNTINSPINQKQVIVAKNLGMVQFFEVDAFPEILNPVYLLGNLSPDLGMAKLTNGIVYDYAVGDVFQYHETVYYNYGPPGQDADRFTRYTITGKVISVDSVFYTATRHAFDKGNSIATNDFITLKYKANEVIAQIPYEYTNPAEYFYNSHSLRFENYCGAKRWTYRIKPDAGLRYCSIDNCWGPNDVPGPAPTQEDVYTCGLGLYYSIYWEGVIHWNDPGYHHTSEIIYSVKNGVECGSQAILGMDENPASDKLFSVFPNPANDFIAIETPNTKGNSLTISAVNGLTLIEQELSEKTTQIDISQLKSGIYLFKLTTDKSVMVKKIVINKH